MAGSPEEWLRIAVQNMEAAGRLKDEQMWRSSISRGYYAGHAAVHAVLIHFERTPPRGRNTWKHRLLPLQLADCLRQNLATRLTRNRTNFFKNALTEAYNYRLNADYGAAKVVDEASADECFRHCGGVVKLGKEILGWR